MSTRLRMSWRRNYVTCHLLVIYQDGDCWTHSAAGEQTFLSMFREHFVKLNKITDNKRSPTVGCCTFVLGDIFQIGALRSSFQWCINYRDQVSSECTPSTCHIGHLKGTSVRIPLMSYWAPAETLHLVSAKPVHTHDSISPVHSVIFGRKAEDDESSHRNRR